MTSRTNLLFGMAAVLAAASTPALAHHSFAMFDQQKSVELKGTVKEFEWANPHAALYVVVPSESGAPTEWWIEMSSIGAISRGGWRRDTVKAGDPITLQIHPLKDGSDGGQFLYAVLADGRKLGQVDGGFSISVPGGDEEGLRQAERDDAARRAGRPGGGARPGQQAPQGSR